MLAGRLAPGGTAVVTVNGGPMTAGVADGKVVLHVFRRMSSGSWSTPTVSTGLGYRDYPDQEDYGLSVSSTEKVAEIAAAAGLRVVAHLEGAWAPPAGHPRTGRRRARGQTVSVERPAPNPEATAVVRQRLHSIERLAEILPAIQASRRSTTACTWSAAPCATCCSASRASIST